MSTIESSKKKIVGIMIVVALATFLSCTPSASRRPPVRRRPPAESDSLTVFLTGSSLGRLKPCGCSGGQLGGLERRPAIFNTVPPEKRLLIDTGALVPGSGDQDLIKFGIIVEALARLNYQVVNLTDKDVEIARNQGWLDAAPVRFVSPYASEEDFPIGFQNRYLMNGEYVTISVLSVDVDRSSLDQIKKGLAPAHEGDKTVGILIVNRRDDDVIASIAQLGVVDCIVCPSEAEEPMIIGSPSSRPLVFSVGRYGRYICSLKIEKARVRDRFKFKFTAAPVTEDLPKDPALVELYKGYQQIVRDSNLLERHPRFSLPDGLKYVGSESCKLCHAPEYQKWLETGHAKAYATLVEGGYQFDPECVVCHVVGLDWESGFVSEQETPGLKNVDCENCHGPGSQHVKTYGTADTAGPKSSCIDCHTPEHSGEYAGNEDVFRQKIIHWTEPNTPGNVK